MIWGKIWSTAPPPQKKEEKRAKREGLKVTGEREKKKEVERWNSFRGRATIWVYNNNII